MNRKPGELTDRFGAVASSLCAVHCAICGFLPAAFAMLGLGFLLSQKVEWFLVLVAVFVGSMAVKMAWQTHRSSKVLGLLCLGIVGLLTSRGLEMGSSHEGHHGDVHHDEVHHDEVHHDDGHHDEVHHDEVHHDDGHHDDGGASELARGEEAHGHGGHGEEEGLHILGAGIGGAAGLLLFWGHLINIRATRRFREEGEECCD